MIAEGPAEHADRMTDREDFLTWVRTALYAAEFALHDGDPAPRRAIWSRTEPVSVLGAWRSASGQREIDELFTALGKSFSHCTSYAFELLAYDVIGDMPTQRAWSTSRRPSTASRAPTRCEPPRCTGGRTAPGGSPTATATP